MHRQYGRDAHMPDTPEAAPPHVRSPPGGDHPRAVRRPGVCTTATATGSPPKGSNTAGVCTEKCTARREGQRCCTSWVEQPQDGVHRRPVSATNPGREQVTLQQRETTANRLGIGQRQGYLPPKAGATSNGDRYVHKHSMLAQEQGFPTRHNAAYSWPPQCPHVHISHPCCNWQHRGIRSSAGAPRNLRR